MAAQKASRFRDFQLTLQSSSSVLRRLRPLRLSLAGAMSAPSSEPPPPPSPTPMIYEAIDEETIPNSCPNDYYSLHPGQVFNERWKEEPESSRYVAVKIGACTYGSIAAAEHELKLSQRIAMANPSHPGAGYIRTPIDNFQIGGFYVVITILNAFYKRKSAYAIGNERGSTSLPAEKQYKLKSSLEFTAIEQELEALSLDPRDDSTITDRRKELRIEKRKLIIEELYKCRKL
ncbi:hypothetical protein G7Y89_g6684 [Cudoniella acicularis]|uniref:Uncharacterized protein n=1 Tax=Cudoniella acicularis TaxID=354080 RepID=A0A8H4RMJ1_9HELO|nr:hypothetical protein G7Y89_g6684 [Cudoniella acicularis]